MSFLIFFTVIAAFCVNESWQIAGHSAVVPCTKTSGPIPQQVVINSCPINQAKCQFRIGEPMYGSAYFTTSSFVRFPQYEVYGYKSILGWFDVGKQINIDNVDVCKSFYPSYPNICSLYPQRQYRSQVMTPIPSDSILGDSDAEIYLKDRANNNVQWCFRVKLHITN